MQLAAGFVVAVVAVVDVVAAVVAVVAVAGAVASAEDVAGALALAFNKIRTGKEVRKVEGTSGMV